MASSERNAARKVIPTVSQRLPDGRLVELIHLPETARTAFAVWRDGDLAIQHEVDTEVGERLVPIPATNNLLKHRALLLPGEPESYGSIGQLIGSIREYLFRYVDLSEQFQRLASYYILLTWVYAAFNELPYLRLRGDFGTGKTRALLVLGSLCYKAFFASGASTVSPIFHTLDTFRGTLIFDEADFRFSDEKAELVKIFNNGNAKGFPVLRTAVTVKKEFDPRAFNVFGPKIVAMRRSFEDQALERKRIHVFDARLVGVMIQGAMYQSRRIPNEDISKRSGNDHYLFDEKTVAALKELGDAFAAVHRRLISEGYVLQQGRYVAPKHKRR